MKYIIPTIDVEAIRSLSRLGNFDQFILGKIKNDHFGTTKIAEIINEYGGSGTFYVDFAERDHGLDKLKNLSEDIKKNNSDVQLHIHPQFISDKSRYLLNSYTKIEQEKIIKECIDIFETCVGEKPISFRAGGYSADNSTLEILSENGIKIDSSYFHKHKWCKIEEIPINVVSKINSIYEIPVTIFNNNISYDFLGMPIKKGSLIKKLDIDGCSKEELTKGFDSLNSSGIRIIVLFLHSYSLINWSSDFNSISADKKDIEKLRHILEHAKSSGYTIESVKNISNNIQNYVNDNSIVPTIKTNRNIITSTYRTVNAKYRKIIRGN